MAQHNGHFATHIPAVKDVHIIWLTAGLGCDGDSVSITAATQPSLEDLVFGAFPGLPKVHLHNPVLAYECGEEFMRFFYQAAEGRLDPFVFVVEGSIPNETIKKEGYWAAQGTDKSTGQPITTCEWIDRLAPKAWAVVAIGTCAAYGGIHAMEGNPTGCMGLADYLGWNFKSKASLPIVNVPGCPVQPDNFMETVLHLLYHAAGLRRRRRSTINCDPSGCSAKRCTKVATAAATMNRPSSRRSTGNRNAWSSWDAGDLW